MHRNLQHVHIFVDFMASLLSTKINPKKLWHRCETLRNYKGMVVLQSLKVSHLFIFPNRFYETPKLKNWMCELCTFPKSSHICSCSPVILLHACTIFWAPWRGCMQVSQQYVNIYIKCFKSCGHSTGPKMFHLKVFNAVVILAMLPCYVH